MLLSVYLGIIIMLLQFVTIYLVLKLRQSDKRLQEGIDFLLQEEVEK